MTVITLVYFHAKSQIDTIIVEGTISYRNTQNVYVRFANTKGIEKGDTLFVYRSGQLIPALIVNQLSSISCVTTPVESMTVQTSEKVVHQSFRSRASLSLPEAVPPKEKTQEVPEPDNELDRERLRDRTASFRGRLGVGSYTNFSAYNGETNQRMRYTFSLDAKNIEGSKFSFETYAIFRHTANQWETVKANLANALKIYNLAVRFEPDEKTELVLGRKINRNMSNVGAIDGLQVSRRIGAFTLGGIVGTRPDNQDFSLNKNQVQFGGFAAHQKNSENGGNFQTTIAFMEQKYFSKTDRRFLYFQHTNSIVKNLNLFSSVELDLYKIEGQQVTNMLDPTSIFLSLHYRYSRKLSFSASYDARKNVIYYESFRNFIDRLIEQETRQGSRFRFSYRPFKYVTLGSSIGYRFQKDQQNTSKNLYSFINISRIPWLQASATISTTLLKSNYLEGTIYGIVFSKDLLNGKMFSEANYRHVKYRYGQLSSELNQHIGALNLSGKITKNLSVSVNYEVTFEKARRLNRIYTNIIQRF